MSDDDSSEDFGPKDEPRASSEFAARALNRLVGEALVATPPDLDWQCIEARLLAGIEAERVAIAPKPRGSFGAAVSFIAVAAAIVLLVTSGRGPSPTAIPSPTRLIDVATLPSVEHGDGGRAQLASALGPGAAIETGAVAERLVLPGVAAFTLAPNSRVVIRAVAIPYVLELERGEVTASVVPRHDPDHVVEAFVVESGGVRVAVHGTVFSVRRSGEKIEVYVSEGVVAVGPAGYRGETSGTLLVSPARAVFGTADARLIASLPSDGSHAAVALSGDTRTAPTLAPVAAPDLAGDVDAHGTSQGVQGVQGLHAAPAGLARHGHEPAADADSHERGALHAPTSEAARASAKTASRAAGISAGMSVSAARAAMIACLRSATANTPGAQLSVTVATHITVTLDGDARVTTVQFVPPLRPKIQGKCAAVLWGATVVGAGESFVIPFATR